MADRVLVLHTRWEDAGLTEKLLTALRVKARVQQGREPEPSAEIIDSQSVKGAGTVGRDSRGYDAGKKVNGRKRLIVTDTLGMLVTVTVLAASRGRIATAPSGRCSAHTWPPRSGTSSPIKASPDAWLIGPETACVPPWRSSASRPSSAASPCTPAGGWWNAP